MLMMLTLHQDGGRDTAKRVFRDRLPRRNLTDGLPISERIPSSPIRLEVTSHVSSEARTQELSVQGF